MRSLVSRRYSLVLVRSYGGPWFERSDTLSAVLARNWWAVALRGAVAILFGIVAFLLPEATLTSLVLLFAAYLLVDGVLGVAAGLRATSRRERWGTLVLEGCVGILAGAVALLWPTLTVLAFVLLAAAWAVLSGALMVLAAFRLTGAHGRWLLGLGGLVSVAWGVLLFAAPAAGAVVLAWWLGAYALLFGVVLLALAFRLRGIARSYRRRGS